MTINKYDGLLSFNQKEETVIDKMLKNKSITQKEMAEELELEGFSQTDFSEALLTYVEYSTENFVMPQKFTKSYIDHSIQFTNRVNIADDNTYLIKNINLLQEKITDLLPNLEVIRKDNANDKRLLKICELYDWDLSNDVDPESHNLYKFEGETEIRKGGHTNSFRVFVGIKNPIEDNKKICMLFIDPYHLAVPSGHKYTKHGRHYSRKEMIKNTFMSCKYYPHDIHLLIENKIKK